MKEVQAYTAKKSGNIMLNANELYQNIPAPIMEEVLSEIAKISFHRYPDETNSELIRAYSKVSHVKETKILAGNGSDEMLGLMIGYFLKKGKKLYTLAPDFSMYDYYAAMYEADIIKYPCQEDGSFDVDDFIAYGKDQQVDMILFSNPNNPTGHALHNEDLMRIVEAFAHIPVMIDEAYGEFHDESMIDHIDDYTNLYVTRTLSKAYGLAGARLGFLMGNEQSIAAIRPYMVPYNISSISQKIGCVVLRHAQEYQETIVQIKQQRERVYDHMRSFTRLHVYPSKANYLFGRSEEKKEMMRMLETEGIIIRNYPDNSFRITIGSPEENDLLIRVLDAFEKGGK